MAKNSDQGEHYVTFRHVVYAAPLVIVAMMGFGSIVVGFSNAEARSVKQDLLKHELEESKQINDLKDSTKEAVQRLEARVVDGQNDTRSLYIFLSTKQPQPQLTQPVAPPPDPP